MDHALIEELVSNLEAEINNGGFDQYFFNSAGDKTVETIRALERIGANKTASIVKDAAAKFPDGQPSPDRNERQKQLEVVSPESDAFEEQDNAFLAYTEDLLALVTGHSA